jgi:hypothetical protein
MTNKKKTTRPPKDTTEVGKQRAALKDAANTLRKPPEIRAFSKSQLAILILVSLGVSRLLQIGGAITKEGTTDTAVCQEYLGLEACADAAISALIRYKYFTGIQCALLVMLVFLQYLLMEENLARFNTLMIVVPIALSVAAHYASAEWIPIAKIWRHLTMCIVLTAVAAPSDYSSLTSVPFLSGQKQPAKTLQSLVIMTLGLASLWEAFQLLQPLVDANAPALLTIEASSSAITSVLYFLAVDKITNAAVYFFSWFYMEENRQRVSTVCFIVE